MKRQWVWCLAATLLTGGILAEKNHHVQRLVVEGETEFVALEEPFPVGASLQVTANEVPLVEGVEYLFDPRANLLRFRPPLPVGTVLVVTYDAVSLPISRESSLDIFGLTVAPQLPGIPTRPKEEPSRLLFPPTPPLTISGAKTFSVSAGNRRSFAPDQSLRVELEGEVLPGVAVTATLTDQQTPIQPEGITEELDRLDDVLIRVRGERFSASLGDDKAQLVENELVFSSVQMQGVQTRGVFEWGEGQFLAALPRGRSESLTLVGVEGQNAYRLTAGNRFVVVVAGSERVWLNGVPMRRGYDYIIRDYGDPILEFTAQHLITGNDVIRVDYEYRPEDEEWRRSLYAARAGFHTPNERVRLGVSFASESDDAHRPLGALSEDERKALRRGEALSLTPPIRREVLGLDGSWTPSERSRIRGVWAFNRTDENTLFLGKPPSESAAWRLTANLDSETLRFEGEALRLGASFQPVGSSRTGRLATRYETQFQRDAYGEALLGTLQKDSPQVEELYDARLQWTPLREIAFAGRFGVSRHDDVLRHDWNSSVLLRRKNLPQLRYERRHATRPDYAKTQEEWNLLYQQGKFQTAYTNRRFFADADDPDRNLRHAQQTFRANLTIGERFSAGLRYEQERRQNLDAPNAVWRTTQQAQTTAMELGMRFASWSRLTTTLARRTFADLVKGGSALRTILADVQMNAAPFRRALDTGIRFSVDRRLSSRREEIFTNVVVVEGVPVVLRKGQGTHVKVDALRYVEDPEEGDYIRVVRTIGDTPVTVVEGQVRCRFEPVRFFTLDGRWNLSEERDAADLNELLRFDRYRSERTVYGQLVSYLLMRFEPKWGWVLELEANGNNALNRRLNRQSRRETLDVRRAQGRGRLTKRFSLEANTEWRLSREWLEQERQSLSQIRREERESAFGGRFQWNPQGFVFLKGFDERERTFESLPTPLRAYTSTQGSEVQWTWLAPQRGRAEITYRVGYGRLQGSSLPLALYRFYEGFHQEVRVRSEVRIRSATDLTARVNYRMIAAKKRPTEHRLDVELVAEL